jgi:hypothetical protein
MGVTQEVYMVHDTKDMTITPETVCARFRRVNAVAPASEPVPVHRAGAPARAINRKGDVS